MYNSEEGRKAYEEASKGKMSDTSIPIGKKGSGYPYEGCEEEAVRVVALIQEIRELELKLEACHDELKKRGIIFA